MILLATDYGWRGPWVGQVHATLASAVPAVRVIDWIHDLPAFEPAAAAHLLAALIPDAPEGAIVLGVVDPGVGTTRDAVVVEADGRWLVGPGNGLFDVASARAQTARWWRIERAPERDSATFHGRDLFAPVAAAIARGEAVPGERMEPPHGEAAARDRAAVIYVDGFGNAATGLRPAPTERRALCVGEDRLARGRTFADVTPGAAMWLVNSIGLAEIVINRGHAARRLGLEVGTPVSWAN